VDRQHDGRTAGKRAVAAPGERRGVPALHLRTLNDAGNLAERHGPALPRLHHHLAQLLDRLNASQGTNEQLVWALIVQVTTRRVGVALDEGGFHLLDAYSVTQQPLGREKNLELFPVAAHDEDLRDARNGQ